MYVTMSLHCYLPSNIFTSLPSEPAEPCSRPIAAHYSFDVAQQVHYPCDPLQPGLLYFIDTKKVWYIWSVQGYHPLASELPNLGGGWHLTLERGPKTLYQSCTTFSASTDVGRRMCTCMPTTVQGKIRTIP